MKKVIFTMAFCAIVAVSCEKEQSPEIENEQTLDDVTFLLAKDKCGSMSVLEEKLAKDPTLALKMQAVEDHTKLALSQGFTQKLLADGSIEIPVVFHIIYRTASENIPDSQIQDQLDALNEDFNLNNPGRNTIPAEFSSVESDINISFTLQEVKRVYNKKRFWRPNNDMKFVSPVVNPTEFLNVWVVNSIPYKGGNILGYAQFPGDNRSTDGIVLAHRYTGTTQYSTGRTATHEVGHWLNLRHIWGDGGCGASDFVSDTPDADGPSRGCPTYPTASCGTNDMTMNFMDYSDDECLNMFTEGQRARMWSVFANGGYRADMAD